MKIAKQIASNTIAQVAAKFINAAISVVIIKLITHYMAAEGYGRYTLVYEFIAFFGIAADLGLFTIAVNEMAKTREKLEKILGNILSLRIGLVILLGVLASILAFFVPKYTTEIRIGIMIAAVGMGVNLLSITIASVLQVHLKMTYNAIALVAGKVLMVGYIWFVTVADLGFLQLIMAGLVGNTVALVLTFFYARKFASIRLSFDVTLIKDLVRKSFIYGVALMFGAVYLSVGIIVLRYYWDEATVGIYGVALRVYQLMIIIPFAFMNSALPSITRALKEKYRLQDIIQNSFDVLAILGFGILGGTLFLSHEIISFISSGDEFAPAAVILNIFSISVLLTFLNNLFSYILLVINKQKYFMWINAAGALLAVVAAFILIPLPGLLGKGNGLAIANILAPLLTLIGTYYFARKHLDFTVSIPKFFRIVSAALGMMGILWLFDTFLPIENYLLKTAVYTLVGGLSYFVFLIAFKGLSPQALEMIFKRNALKRLKKDGSVIAVDIRSISGEKTGKEWYTQNLLESLGQIDDKNIYLLYTKYKNVPLDLPENFIIKRFRVPLILWHPLVFLDLWFLQVDYWLAPASYIIPSMLFTRRPKLITVIHDTVAFMFPKKHQWKARMIEKITVGLTLKHSEKIVAVSENTKSDIQKFFPGHEDKTIVITEGARTNFTLIQDKNIIKRTLVKYDLPNQFIVFVGTLEPRKNLVRLINAYSLLTPDLQNQYPLILIGKKGWYHNEIFDAIKERNMEDHVYFTGYIPDEDLPHIINAATVFVMPSLYEGFGLPILEAQACGVPVVSSNTPALMEVVNSSGLTFDPLDEFEIAETLKTVLENKSLREELKKKGMENSKQYNWIDIAKEFTNLFH